MGALLGFFGSAALAPAALLRLKALLIGAIALAVIALALTTWALFERSGRLELKVEVVQAQARAEAWEGAAGRCTASVDAAAKAGSAATAETKRLLAMAERALERNAMVRDEIRGIVAKPVPVRADGKSKDCGDAWKEISNRVTPK